MYKYHVFHSHQSGVTSYIFASPESLFSGNWMGEDEQYMKLAQKLNINYEPHRNEFLDITDITEDVAIVLSKEDIHEIQNA